MSLFSDLRRILKELLPSPAMVEQAEVLRIQTQMEEIRRPFWAISAVIFDAHLRAMALKEQDLDDWMADVGAAMVDLEDLLASIINRQEERALESGRRSSRSSSLLLPARLAFRVVILRKLKKMGRILNGLVERGYAFDLRKEPMDSMDPLRDGYSAILKDEVKESRRAEYEEIMEHLQQQQREEVEIEMDSTMKEEHSTDDIIEMEMHSTAKEEYSSVEMDAPFRIVIEGREGRGKRTLARMIYHDEWVRQHFHHRFWVDASNFYSGDVAGIGREIARSMVGHGNYSEGSSLQEMWVFVDRQLAGRRYLLILAGYDWSYTYSEFGYSKRRKKWNELKDILLRVGGPGSTIIATTTYSYTIPGEFRLELQRISDEDLREIFMRWAFAYDRPDQDKHKEEEDMAREMDIQIYLRHYVSTRLYYLNPFDAKVMGSVLRYIEISRWHSDLEKIFNDERENLIKLYLDDQRYRSIAFHRSLFMDDDDDDNDNIFILEDFMHSIIANGLLPLWSDKDLRVNYMFTVIFINRYMYGGKYTLKNIQNQYYFTINLGIDSPVIPKQSRHLRHLCLLFSFKASTTSFSILPLFERNKLRTLIFRCSRDYILLKDPKYKIPPIPERIFATLTHLHTLYLQNSKIQYLLSAIGRLHNLRYLNLSYTDIHKFSRSLCNLQNLHILNLAYCQNLEKLSGQIHRLGRLQILKLAFCEKLQMLPATITNLANLQELDLEGCPWLVQLPQGFTNMKRLVELNMHNCVSLTQMPREIGALTNLFRLSGYHANDEFGSAMVELQNLVNLRELRLEKLEQIHREEEIVVYLGLQKKTNLKYLALHWQWWDIDLDTEASIEQQMRHLEDLKPYVPNLKELEIISYMGNRWPSWMLDISPFTSLTEIKLINLSRCKTIPPLVELKDLEIVEISGMNFIDVTCECSFKFTLSEMHKLESLWIKSIFSRLEVIHCPKLRAINLRNTCWCTELKLWLNNKIMFTSEFKGWNILNGVYELEIVGCQELKFLPEDMKFLNSLRKLTIICCNNLITLPDWMGEGFPCLESLEICNCPALTSIPAIPKGTLKQITIQGCPILQFLPDVPCKLKQITIEGCPKLHLPPGVKQGRRR